MKSLFVNEGYC